MAYFWITVTFRGSTRSIGVSPFTATASIFSTTSRLIRHGDEELRAGTIGFARNLRRRHRTTLNMAAQVSEIDHL